MSPILKRAYQPYKWILLIPLIIFFTGFFSVLCIITGITLGPDPANIVAVTWARICCAIVPIQVAIRGKKNLKSHDSYVIVANHQSMADIPVLHGFLGLNIKWIMKQELGRVPIFGTACRALGCIYVDRKNPDLAIKSIEEARKRLSSKASVLFFAEGTRSRDGRVLAFKKGAFRFALETGLPILPVTIKNSLQILPSDSVEIMPGQVDIVIHRPLEPDDYRQMPIDDLVRSTRHTISAAI